MLEPARWYTGEPPCVSPGTFVYVPITSIAADAAPSGMAILELENTTKAPLNVTLPGHLAPEQLLRTAVQLLCRSGTHWYGCVCAHV
jgi:hypothetical protein